MATKSLSGTTPDLVSSYCIKVFFSCLVLHANKSSTILKPCKEMDEFCPITVKYISTLSMRHCCLLKAFGHFIPSFIFCAWEKKSAKKQSLDLLCFHHLLKDVYWKKCMQHMEKNPYSFGKKKKNMDLNYLMTFGSLNIFRSLMREV